MSERAFRASSSLADVDRFIAFFPAAAEHLGATPETAKRLASAHQVDTVKIGRMRCIRESGFRMLMAKVQPTAKAA